MPYTESYDDAAIAEVSASLYQKLSEANMEPEETELPKAARDAEVSHPSTMTKTTRRVNMEFPKKREEQ